MLSAVSRLLPPALVADWQNPLLFSWTVDPAVLQPITPAGLELDYWQDSTYVSLVGVRFESVRVFGLPAPPRAYDEINLRFYVRRPAAGGDPQPGVVFIRQAVPHRLTAFVARACYGEPFIAAPTAHQFDPPAPGPAGLPRRVEYRLFRRGRWHEFWAEADYAPETPAPGSLAEFLTRRYWGYNGKPRSRSRAYRLTRPDWPVRPASHWGITPDFSDVYDAPLSTSMREAPASILLATGSKAAVSMPSRL